MRALSSPTVDGFVPQPQSVNFRKTLSSEYGTCKTVKSRPDPGPGFEAQVLDMFQVVPSSLDSGEARFAFLALSFKG